jgi:hypothetical protein
LDKFYTKPAIAEKYISTLLSFLGEKGFDSFDYLLEPSAGSGSFYFLLPKDKRIGLDIEPDNSEIIKQDFFSFIPNYGKKYLTIGNPPFGRVNSLAVRFFNKASYFSEYIAFIVPRSFKRVSVQNRLNRQFHLVYQEDTPDNSFEPHMAAKCVFQIWKKESFYRETPILKDTTKDFFFCKIEEADFAILAYGGKCGRTVTNLEGLSIKSWHFIKASIDVNILLDRLSKLDYSFTEDTVRQNSLGKKELVHLYNLSFKEAL